jgi:hypothetical protein
MAPAPAATFSDRSFWPFGYDPQTVRIAKRRMSTMLIKALVPATFAVAFLTGAAAASQTITGEIETINPKAHSITLWNGRTYMLGHSVDMSTLKRNRDFDITYVVQHGRDVVTAISETPAVSPH